MHISLLFAMRAQAYESDMAFRQPIAGDLFQLVINRLQLSLRNFPFLPANTADQVVVLVARKFIFQLPAASMGDTHQFVLRQKIKCAINGWFRQARRGSMDTRKNFSGRKVAARSVQGIHNRHTLGSQAEPFFANLLGKVVKGTGHILIVTYYNRKRVQERNFKN
jgi:hypothetical protein